VIQSGELGFGCKSVNFCIVADLFKKFYGVVYEHDQCKFDKFSDKEKKAAKAFNEHNMNECFYKFNELLDIDEKLSLDQIQDDINVA